MRKITLKGIDTTIFVICSIIPVAYILTPTFTDPMERTAPMKWALIISLFYMSIRLILGSIFSWRKPVHFFKLFLALISEDYYPLENPSEKKEEHPDKILPNGFWQFFFGFLILVLAIVALFLKIY